MSKNLSKNLISSSLLTVLSLAVLITMATAAPAPQSTTKKAKGGATMTYGNSDSINEDEMKIYDYFLASDQLEGRNLPSRGYDTAALYVASHLAEWHLKPMGSTSGTNGPLQPYFQPFELVSGYVMNKSGANPYDGLDVHGKIVVVAGVPAELVAQLAAGGGRGAAPVAGQPAPLQACTDFLTPEQAAAKNGAIAVINIANYQQLTAMANPGGAGGRGGGRGPGPNGPAYQVTKFQTTPGCPKRSGNS